MMSAQSLNVNNFYMSPLLLTPPGMGVDKEGKPVCEDRFNAINLIHSTFPGPKQCLFCAKPFDRVKIDSELEKVDGEMSRHNVDRYLVNQVDQQGQSVLYKSVINGDEEIVKILLEKGVDVNFALEGGETALDRALWQWWFNRASVQADLRSKRNNKNEVTEGFFYHFEKYKRDVAIVRLLIIEGARANTNQRYLQEFLEASCGPRQKGEGS